MSASVEDVPLILSREMNYGRMHGISSPPPTLEASLPSDIEDWREQRKLSGDVITVKDLHEEHREMQHQRFQR